MRFFYRRARLGVKPAGTAFTPASLSPSLDFANDAQYLLSGGSTVAIDAAFTTWNAVTGSVVTTAAATGGNNPTRRSNGVQTNASAALTLGATVSVTGPWTLYFVGSRTDGENLRIVGTTANTGGIQVASGNALTVRADSGVAASGSFNPTGRCCIKVTRDGSNVVTGYATGGLTQTFTKAGTLTLNYLIGYSTTNVSGSNERFERVLFWPSLLSAGNQALIEAYILATYNLALS